MKLLDRLPSVASAGRVSGEVQQQMLCSSYLLTTHKKSALQCWLNCKPVTTISFAHKSGAAGSWAQRSHLARGL